MSTCYYEPVDNKKAIRLFKKREAMLTEQKILEREIKRMQKMVEKLEFYNDKVWSPDFKIIDGILLGFIDGMFGGCNAIGDDVTRYARWYVNANDETKFGLEISDRQNPGSFSDNFWRGADWPTLSMVQEAAIKWVTKGIDPGMNGKDMGK